MRPGFYSECQLWRNRSTGNFLEEVYDGQIWKEFQHFKGAPFLALPFAFAYILNIDWFQPFTHTVASIGVVYLTIINLPRYLRYKRENVILVGIIPGPHEPKLHINTFLRPLVNELLEFWDGVKLSIHTSSGVGEYLVKGAILCVACDIPAGRKTCGFVGHTANLGCSKVFKSVLRSCR